MKKKPYSDALIARMVVEFSSSIQTMGLPKVGESTKPRATYLNIFMNLSIR
jgi:hypothetical protein